MKTKSVVKVLAGLTILLVGLGVLAVCKSMYQIGTAHTSGNEVEAATGHEQSSEPRSPYLSAPFDLNTGNVGPDFKGDDIDTITARLQTALHKGEFESSQEYEKRTASFLLQPIMGSIMLDSHFAFGLGDTANYNCSDVFSSLNCMSWNPLSGELSYDADRQVFTVHMQWGWEGSIITQLGSGLALDGKSEPHDFVWELPMSPDKAKDFKTSARIIVICKLTAPWYRPAVVQLAGDEYRTKTIDLLHVKPEQFWVVNGYTGEVVQKKDLGSLDTLMSWLDKHNQKARARAQK